MKDETKQIEIQAHICQTSTIIEERFFVSRCYITAYAQTMQYIKLHSFQKTVFFVECDKMTTR